jgi:glycosyltransferase involved in cell wall biosynthesis
MSREIAIFDYRIIPTNPAGSCHLRMLEGLHGEFNFTIFAVEFENPFPEDIRWVRVPAIKRPLALLFLSYHLLAPISYLLHRVRHRVRFDIVQMVESNLSFGDISYSHFCHRAYLREQWGLAQATGIRGWLRWLDHWLHALVEPFLFWIAGKIIVPSQGLACELKSEYPWTTDKIHVIPNPVNLERMIRPQEFNRDVSRKELSLEQDELILVFVALGQYERKGMPLILEALRRLDGVKCRLLVVGGESDLVQRYQKRVTETGLSDRVTFVGMQRDIRPYLWMSDALILPSHYEVFPLVSLEAAAAGLPLIITSLNGVEEFLVDGRNGLLIERSVEGVQSGIRRLLSLPPEHRTGLGDQARLDVGKYSVENFIAAWRAFYAGK